MPHVIVEYSANLEKDLNIQEVVQSVHQAALETGAFEVPAVRTRAERRDCYVIADGHKDNAFVAVTVRIGAGRDPETRKKLGQSIFDALCARLSSLPASLPIGISLEVQEIDPVGAFRKNNLHTIVKERAASAGRAGVQ